MNIINETVNKVRELEKRLDSGLVHNNLCVVEIKKDLEKVNISPNLYNLIASFSASSDSGLVVLQGQFNFNLNKNKDACKTRILIKCDDYVVHSEDIEIKEGKTTYQLLTTLPSCTKERKWLEAVFLPTEGDCFLAGYDCFLWGYGITVYDNHIPKGNINAATLGDKCCLTLVSGKLGYVYVGESPQALNFSVSDFAFVGNALEISPGFIQKTSETGENETNLYCFMVAGGGQLKYLFGENLGSSSAILAKKCTSVTTAASVDNSYLVVAYSVGSSVYYFTFDGESLPQHILLYTFESDVERVSIVQNTGEIFYLMVMLENGKNYMFPSVINFVQGTHEGKLSLKTAVKFE